MEKVSLTALAREHLESARAASSGRSAHTIYGGHEHSLRQTVMALTAGSKLDDHESPGRGHASGVARQSEGDQLVGGVGRLSR